MLAAALADVAARAARRSRPPAASWTTSSCRSSASCATWSSPACGSNVERLAEITERVRAEIRTLEAGGLGARGDGVRPRLAAAARGDPVREARAVAQAARQDRLLHRRARPAGDPRRARDHPQDRALARAQPARQDVLQRPAAAHGRRGRASTRRSCRRSPSPAGWRSTNPNMQNVPIRTELGREIRGCFEAAPGNVLLSADYSQIELRVLAHIADEPVLKEIFVEGEDVHTATASQVFRTPPDQLDRRPALEGEDDQLRHRLRPERLRPGRPARHPARGGQGDHRRLPRPLPRGAGLHRGDDREGHARTATSRPSGAAGGRSPSSRRATGRCARSASASRSTAVDPGHRGRRPEARDGPRRTRSLARLAGAADPHRARRAALRRPAGRGRGRRATPSVAAMVGVWDHDPPLVVDVGVGRTWLDAK